MLKRCLSPLTLVNQVALIVLLSTAIGLAGMAVSGLDTLSPTAL